MKEEARILISSDGPYNNVLKTKPPMCFSQENVDRFCLKLSEILTDLQNNEIKCVLKDIIENVEKSSSTMDVNQNQSANNWGRATLVS